MQTFTSITTSVKQNTYYETLFNVMNSNKFQILKPQNNDKSKTYIYSQIDLTMKQHLVMLNLCSRSSY